MKNYQTVFMFIFFLLINVQQASLQVSTKVGNGFIQTNGFQFTLNGAPFYANGFNAYWLIDMALNPFERYKVTSAFREAVNNSLFIGRMWAFSDGGSNPLQSSPRVYNENMFKALDFVISEGGKFGLKLILSLVNNFDGYGGKGQYVKWAKEQGQQFQNDDEFFTNPITKDIYKNHIKTVLTRKNTITKVVYKDDPTIMSWELMNEPRCPSHVSGATIQNWITEMACYFESIDRNHLLEEGLEGFYGPSSSQKNPNNGTDFIANNKVKYIDFVTAHSYPDQWLPNADNIGQLQFLKRWINDHIDDTQHILQKPLLFAEFGKSWKDPRYNISQRDDLYNIVYSSFYNSASKSGAAIGGLFWQLQVEGMESYKDGYEVILTKPSSTVSLVAQRSKKLSCARTRFLTKKKRKEPRIKKIKDTNTKN